MILKKHSDPSFFYEIPEPSSDWNNRFPKCNYLFILSEIEYANPNHLNTLNKIIQALKFSPGQTTHVDYLSPTQSISFKQFSIIEPGGIISFGIEAQQLGLQGFEQKHHVYTFDSKKLLFNELLQFYEHETSKRVLWNALQLIVDRE